MMKLTKVEEYEQLFETNTIIDGVVDEDKYFSSNPRIGWFLKEAYSNEEDEAIGFHIRQLYAQTNAYDNFFRNTAMPTWHPIIYTSFGILNKFIKFEDMPRINDNPEMCEVVKNIAIINANKFPSQTGTTTKWKNLNNGYERCKNIIDLQIKVLQPEIYIFCGTFYLYEKNLGLTDEYIVGDKSKDYWIREKNGKLFLDVNHPSQRRQKRANYVNEIIGAVENWAYRNNKP